MKRLILAFACAALVTIPAHAQQHPNQKKGFNANDVYQFNGLDSINAFNGNLTLTIPISGTYSVGGGLSYALTLYSNANLWEGESHCHESSPGVCATVCPRFNKDCAPWERVDPVFMYPHRRANAGLGWTLGFGRLYQPAHPAMPNQGHWTYESADGADHVFEVQTGSGPVLSRDNGAYIRMTELADDPFTSAINDPVRKIELPDGTVQYFQPPSSNTADYWSLRRITNGFSLNYLKISYGNVPTDPEGRRWTLEDSHGRTHWIDLQRIAYDGENRLLVKKVHLSQFGTDTKATITFNYTAQTLSRGEYQSCTFHHPVPPGSPEQPWQTATVPLLTSIALPDSMGYTFTYDSYGLNYAGVPASMTLPTGGKVEWTYGPYAKPYASAVTGEEYQQLSYGVYTRKLRGKLNELLGTWTYAPVLDCRQDPQYPTELGHCLEFKNTITGPLSGTQGSKTEHYFSVAKLNDISPWKEIEYGLPFTKNLGDGTGQRWLSSRVLNLGGTPLRSTYVRYDTSLAPAQMIQKRLVYDDDSGNYMDTNWSVWDGFGHYKVVQTSGNIPNTPTRTTTTNYLGVGTSAAWNTGLFDSVIVTENGKTSRTDYCFDTSTGFMKGKRIRKGAGLGTTDLLAVFVPDARGNVEWERYYGGDILPVPNRNGANQRPAASVTTTTACNDAAPGTLVYEIRNERVEPTATTSGTAITKYTGVDVKMSDVTIDFRTGLISKSRDTAGVETSYEYDWAGRLLWEKPTGRAWTKYEYLTPASDTITVSKIDASATEPLPWTKYRIDAFGRVDRETTAIPGNAEAQQNTTYNAFGWRTSVSQPGYASALTTFTHDPFGRLWSVTAPDASQTTYTYVGDTFKTRRSWIRTNKNSTVDTPVDTVERYDGYGRLVSVTEKSGPTSSTSTSGADVTTDYTYDLADRLVSVRMAKTAGSGPVQTRLFDYDGRGFLRWESQPEAGVTSYLYDARGNVVTKLHAGGQSPFDLDYFYDAASRVSRIESYNPFSSTNYEPVFRTMKSYEYGSSNGATDLRKGKLTLATRYNYDPRSLNTLDRTTYKIEDTYAYGDAAGRMTSRSTSIIADDMLVRTVAIAQTYNGLDLVKTLKYPMCANCGYSPDVTRENMTRTYDRGRLTSMSGFINSISYWPNGMRNVMQRSNGITDTQVVGEMARPTSIAFGSYRQCVKPVIVSQPGNKTSAGPGQPVQLSVTATGTAPLQYNWFDQTFTWIASTEQITVAPTVTTSYVLQVTNACGETIAESITVSMPPGCKLPETGMVTAVTQPDRTWVLTPNPTAMTARTYKWRKLPSTTIISYEPTLAVGALTSTSTYGLVISDDCGDSTETTVTISVPLAAPVLQATRVTDAQIKVEWAAVTGATSYWLERYAEGSWSPINTNTQSPYYDNNVVASKTYAYRVKATGSGTSPYSNADVATTKLFPEPIAGQAITMAEASGTLDAVNMVRASAGWPALTWSTVLSPSDPIPSSGIGIQARQLLACRTRMNEALQALGVPVSEYTDPEGSLTGIKALHMREVQQRAH